MSSFVNGCVFTPASSGTGSFVVSAAVTGWQTPAQASAANGAQYSYRAYSADNTQWEIGVGVYTSGTVTLTRTPTASSNAGSAVNFTVAPSVALTVLATDLTVPTSLSLVNAIGLPLTTGVTGTLGVANGGTGATTVITAYDVFQTSGANIASASTIVLDTATGPTFDITGTTAVTAVTLATGRERMARAAGAFTLTASATLVINGSATQSYTCSVGDLLLFEGYAASTVRVWVIARSFSATSNARRNRIVNPCGQISQENGNTAGTTHGYYAWDQFAMYRVTSAGTFTAQRVQSVTPKGSKDRFRVTITTADASLAAGEYCTVTTNLEGNNVADFQYGGASAKQSVLTFLWKSPAGTYSIALHNSAANRSYVAQFTPTAANTDQYISIVIPGDTSGTWLTDTGIGITCDFVIAAGSTFQGTNNAWQAGLIYGTATNTNGVGTINSVFEVSDVQLNMDPDLTGVAPAFELPNPVEEEIRCMRYWEEVAVAFMPTAYPTISNMAYWKVIKRVTPVLTSVITSGSGGIFSPTVSTLITTTSLIQTVANSVNSAGSVQGKARY